MSINSVNINNTYQEKRLKEEQRTSYSAQTSTSIFDTKKDSVSINSSANSNNSSSSLREELEAQKEDQGFISKAWDGIKNFFGAKTGSDSVESTIEKYENGEISEEEARKALDDYKTAQGTFTEKLSGVVSTVGLVGTAVGAVISLIPGGQAIGIPLMSISGKVALGGMFADNALDLIDNSTDKDGLTKDEIKDLAIETGVEAVSYFAGRGIGKLTNGLNQVVSQKVANMGAGKVTTYIAGQAAETATDMALSLGADYTIAQGQSLITTGEFMDSSQYWSWDRFTGEGKSQAIGILTGLATSKVNPGTKFVPAATGGTVAAKEVGTTPKKVNVPESDVRAIDDVTNPFVTRGLPEAESSTSTPKLTETKPVDDVDTHHKPQETKTTTEVEETRKPQETEGTEQAKSKTETETKDPVTENHTQQGLKIIREKNKVKIADENGNCKITLSAKNPKQKVGDIEIRLTETGEIELGGHKINTDGDVLKLGNCPLKLEKGKFNLGNMPLGTDGKGNLSLKKLPLVVDEETGSVKFFDKQNPYDIKVEDGTLKISVDGTDYPVTTTNKKLAINGVTFEGCPDDATFRKAMAGMKEYNQRKLDAEKLLEKLNSEPTDNVSKAQKLLFESCKGVNGNETPLSGGTVEALSRLQSYFSDCGEVKFNGNGFTVTKTVQGQKISSSFTKSNDGVITKQITINGTPGNIVKSKANCVEVYSPDGKSIIAKYEKVGKNNVYEAIGENGQLEVVTDGTEGKLLPIQFVDTNLKVDYDSLIDSDRHQMPLLPFELDKPLKMNNGKVDTEELLQKLNQEGFAPSSGEPVLAIVTDANGNIINIARNSLEPQEHTGILDIIRTIYPPSENKFGFSCAEMNAIDNADVAKMIADGRGSELTMISVQYKNGQWQIDPNCSSCFQVRNLFGIIDGNS